jgi:hypothetical protein
VDASGLSSRSSRPAFTEMRQLSQACAVPFPNYKLAGSVERLMNLLTAVDQDVEIVIRNKTRSRRAVRIRVVAA